ncbi:cytochrome b/b6 domain-containing protein [Methylocapsa palsarum]|uniref:Cytochrome b n=1 Tax=Methylocapsa palsarum TaxID=1612308 RepID=A0A1I3W0U0_9HYPH|nr:cytochrome b/b6 domain-containing protein [Methylocapsa palsarum]SFK00237.1 Cytochrome b [Methylocapsa palsarum]
MTTIEDLSESQSVAEREEAQAEDHRVWDLPVRLFHWTLVAAIVAAYITNRLGVSYFRYHVWCGYAVIVLVSFRIIWGLVGTRHALFRNFVRGPVETFRYGTRLIGGRPAHYVGHNPLGAWMVLAFLAALGLQAATGLFGNDEIFNSGPLYGYVSKQASLALTSLHKKLFYWIAAFIAVHVAAVLAHHFLWREKLVHAMITGRKTINGSLAAESIRSSRSWLAAILVLALAGGLSYVVTHAPPAEDESTFQ